MTWVRFIDAYGFEAWHDMDESRLPPVFEIVCHQGPLEFIAEDPFDELVNVTYQRVFFHLAIFHYNPSLKIEGECLKLIEYYEDKSIGIKETYSIAAWRRRGQGLRVFQDAWDVMQNRDRALFKWQEEYLERCRKPGRNSNVTWPKPFEVPASLGGMISPKKM